MNENNVDNETVDGYADTEGESNVGSPDPGTESKNQPLSPDEYAKEQKEAREEDDDK
jgi:hypothetical protein